MRLILQNILDDNVIQSNSSQKKMNLDEAVANEFNLDRYLNVWKKHILHIRVIRIEKFQITHAQKDGQTSFCIIFEKNNWVLPTWLQYIEYAKKRTR